MTHEFSVPNLSCGHCVRAVTEAVKAIDPAATVQADPASKRVQVQSELPRETVSQSLSQAGYTPA